MHCDTFVQTSEAKQNVVKLKFRLIKKYILFVTGLFIQAMGIALAKGSGLGVSPISSVANVLSSKFVIISFGTWVIIWNCILIAAQIIILRRKFRPFQLLQLPLSFLFGWFTDIGVAFLADLQVQNYALKISLVLLGVILLALGIAITIIADVILNSGEAVVKAVSDVSGKNFGHIKVAFDVLCIAASLVLSLIFFDFRIVGIREGTIITALATGLVVSFFTKKLQTPLNILISK